MTVFIRKRMRRSIYRLSIVLAVVATTLGAQTNVADWNTVKALTTGTQVRITAGSRSVRGEIERTTYDIFVVASGKGQEMFDRQQVSVVSVKKPSRRKRNTLIGLAAGAGGGLAIGLATRPGPGQWEIVSSEAVTAGLVGAGAIVGSLIGVIIPTGGWREIYKK